MNMYPRLKETVELYFETKRRVFEIESISAVSPLHQAYVNNIRHSLDHVMSGLMSEINGNNSECALKQFDEAHAHIGNLGPDAHQYIAGVMLENLTKSIESAGFFGKAGKAKSQLDAAIGHYSRGRELRTPDVEQSMQQFKNCIVICKDAILEIEQPTRREVFKFWLGFLGGGGLIGITALILKLLGIL